MLLLVAIVAQLLNLGPSELFGLDFGVFHNAGTWALHGDTVYPERAGANYFIYPPFAAILLIPFALLPLSVSLWIWTGLSMASLWVLLKRCFAPLWPRFGTQTWRPAVVTVVVALALGPVIDTFRLGQTGLMLMLLVVVDLQAIARRRGTSAGVLIGLAAAIKLLPAVFVLFLVLAREIRAAVRAIITIAACWFIAFVVMPDDSKRYFPFGIPLHTAEERAGTGDSNFNQSVRAMLVRHAPASIRDVAWVCVSALVMVLALTAALRYWRRRDAIAVAAVMGMASVLVSPMSWHHHAVWCIAAIATLLRDARDPARVALAAAVAIALAVPTSAIVGGVLVDWSAIVFVVITGLLITDALRGSRSAAATASVGSSARR